MTVNHRGHEIRFETYPEWLARQERRQRIDRLVREVCQVGLLLALGAGIALAVVAVMS